MTPGLGPFRSREEANQSTDWQKHANRAALKYSCCAHSSLTLTFAAGTVLWIAAEFFTGVVWIIAYVLPDYDLWLNSNKGTKSVTGIQGDVAKLADRFHPDQGNTPFSSDICGSPNGVNKSSGAAEIPQTFHRAFSLAPDGLPHSKPRGPYGTTTQKQSD